MTASPPPPAVASPTKRSVARPVANLGNTCYMNAVLQALAHAPELCLAIDCEPHRTHCPVAAENHAKRRASPSSSPEGEKRKVGTRKSRRRSPTTASRASSNNSEADWEFCALCEIEEHICRVHDSTLQDKPVAPSTFVNGFIEHVAPWFKLGVQEDSHEFLRLLIDAMQKSCHRARVHENPQEDPRTPISHENSKENTPENPQDNQHRAYTAHDDVNTKDTEYPFSLFRGTVESKVTCDQCGATSSTLDPIEDVGLEVTLPNATSTTAHANSADHRTQRNLSPVPTPALADVQTAFSRFARAEALDASYKCEKCGKVGRATKQSRLASIPPILTLQLKRFRYGDTRGLAGSTNGTSTGTRRSGRSEVNQLLGSNGGGDYWSTGKSGSAKIEGHIKFDLFFDLKPYLTEPLQAQHKNMFCRLFAVIVHAGKNSHSGHYIAYVRSISKNEWWKMDDGRVTAASPAEVMQADAYMLFYRVVQHPVSVRLEEMNRQLMLKLMPAEKTQIQLANEIENEDAALVNDTESKLNMELTTTKKSSIKRPAAAEFEDGVEWARAKTNMPPYLHSLVRKVEDYVAEDVQLSAECFKKLSQEASQEDAAIGKGPVTPVSEDDVVGGTDKYRRKIIEVFYQISKHPESASFWIATPSHENNGKASADCMGSVAVVEPEDADLL